MSGQEYDSLAVQLCQGDRVAFDTCKYLWAYSRRVDPDTEDRLLVLKTLNGRGIRGERLVTLQKIVCRDSYMLTMAVAHGLRLEFLAIEHVNLALTGGTVLDFRELIDQVRRELPKFGNEMH
jgi:hypothetical protein